MKARPGLSLYNPQQERLGDDAFVESFVARQEELELLLNELRAIADGGATRHAVLIGARGMGKSSMLRRIAIAVGRDAELSSTLMALSFREEQYNVISLDAFWRNCGEALAEWCERHGRDALADSLDRAVASKAWRDPEQARDAFLAICKEIGKRPVLLLDNLDIILDGLKDKAPWLLRAALQAEAGPIVIGGATHLMKQGGDRDAAFYEFFYAHYLEPLSEAEVLACMHALADRNAEAGARVRTVLTHQPERVRTLYALSGGNPRILTLLYMVLQRAETDTIFADLEALLDEVTPFYKARIEEHQTSQQRAVIDAIALHWDPIGSRAISEATGIEVTTISSHLSRLKKSGFIDEVESSGARSSYQLSERFMNIWYLMRHGTRRTRQRLRWLTLFLVRLFSPEEIRGMAEELRTGGPAKSWHESYREAVLAAEEVVSVTAKVDERIGDRDLEPTVSRDKKRRPSVFLWDDDWVAAQQAVKDGNFLQALERIEKVHRAMEETLEPEHQELVGRILIIKGLTLVALDRPEDAILIYDGIATSYFSSEVAGLQEQVVDALVYKAITLGQLGRLEDAIAVSDEVSARYASCDASSVQEALVRVLLNKGNWLGQLGRSEEEIAVYDDVLARFASTEVSDLQEQVADALVSKAITLGQLGRLEDAIAVSDEVSARYASFEASGVQDAVVRAMLNKGVTLGQLGRLEEEIAVYEEVVARFASSEVPGVQEWVANAMVSKGITLGQLGRSEDAIVVYDELLARFASSKVSGVQEEVARALLHKGIRLGKLDRSEDAIAVYDEVFARFESSEIPIVQEAVARATLNKSVRLGQLGRWEHAIAVIDEVLARFASSKVIGVQEAVARGFVNKGVTLYVVGRTEEALAVYEEVAKRFAFSQASSVQKQVARALGNKGKITLQMYRDWQLAETAIRDALAIDPANLDWKQYLAWALLFQNRVKEPRQLREELTEIDPAGLALLDAGLELVRENFGLAASHLGEALDHGIEYDRSAFVEDLLCVLLLAKKHNLDERMIKWFEETGNHDKNAPVFAALVAYVRGERFLNDVNPETRGVAKKLFDRLTASDKIKDKEEKKPKRRRKRKA